MDLFLTCVESNSLRFGTNLSAIDQLGFKLMVNQAEIELRVKSLQIWMDWKVSSCPQD